MNITHKLDKPFGPTGSITGVILFIAGIVILYFSITGLVLVLLGAFLGFTTTAAIIDTEKKRVKFSTRLFGIIPAGQWRILRPDMKLGIVKSGRVWRTYSRSNRSLDLEECDYRLVLHDSAGNRIMELKKYSDPDSAKQDMEIISQQLGLTGGMDKHDFVT